MVEVVAVAALYGQEVEFHALEEEEVVVVVGL